VTLSEPPQTERLNQTVTVPIHRLALGSRIWDPQGGGRLSIQRRIALGLGAAALIGAVATRSIGEVTQHERREAERLTAGYVDELVAAGAGACAPLRPAGA
jgi:hypothetical protein